MLRFRSLTIVLALLLAGCAAPIAPATGGVAPSGSPGAAGPTGRLVAAINSQTITSLDAGGATVSTALFTLWPIYDGLTQIDSDGKLQPALATSWRAVDDQAWEFTLGDWTFHNGRAMTIDDVLGSFERYRNRDNALSALALFSNVESMAGSGKTITFKTRTVDPAFPATIGHAMVTPMAELNAQGPVEFFRKPIGSGPFKLVSASLDSAIIYEAAGPEHKTPRGRPKVKDLELRIVPDAGARWTALQSGVVDFASRIPQSQMRPAEAAGFTVKRIPGTATFSYLLDLETGPTANLKVRQAINYAIDKEGIVQAVWSGSAMPDGQLLGPNALGYTPNVKPYPFDVAKAKQLMAEAGYANGFNATLTHVNTTTSPQDVAAIVAAQLKEIGINVEVRLKEIAVWSQENSNNQKNATLWAQILNYDQNYEAQGVYRWFSSDFTIQQGRRWSDSEFDRFYQEAKRTIDPQRRAQLYGQAAERLNSQAVCLFIAQPLTASAHKKSVVAPTAEIAARFWVDIRLG
jgi:peptide/nickel transport system substrate-binding protein